MTGFKPLPWDTEFFERQVAIASEASYTTRTFYEMLDAAKEAGTECLYLLVSAAGTHTLGLAQEAGSRLVDIRVTLTQWLAGGKHSDPDSQLVIRRAHEEETNLLVRMASDCFTDTRFYRDPGFTKAQCDGLYRTWIEKSCQGWADVVLVSELDQDPVGFISCHLEEDGHGKIGLVCVRGAARGRGAGRQLVNAALDWFEENAANRASVVTQGSNIAALQLFQRCGFAVTSIDVWFHKWFT
jgi:dTDP-4-amino-4,6-dideoxy-D-galactose acyltransferase